ncbi:MAG TPA: cytochrome D1 domain-containing protein [Candidatus Acidoferrum sp.]|nr:cytochrome D1 domain-containing protein [Candidatus Acidoferrum sp.]
MNIAGRHNSIQHPARRILGCLLTLVFGLCPAWGSAQTPGDTPGPGPTRVVHEGVAVEASVLPAGGGQQGSGRLLEGEDARVRFAITDAATGTPMAGLHPSAWMDLLARDRVGEIGPGCRERVQSYLQGSLSARPEIDLNSYYAVTLNRESNLSIIDPILGFGGSRLLSLVLLNSPGADWVLSRDQQRLFVSMPLVDQVAVVDTATWKVVANIAAGVRPTRVALQSDGKYLWAANEPAGGASPEGGVSIIDMDTLKAVTHLRTGAGPHGIAFTDDDRFAFVTNMQDGTLSVIDVRKLAKLKDLKVGPRPVSLAFSPLSKAVYVVSEGQGTIVVVDGQRHSILTRIKARPGLRAIRFVPDGRWGFVVNRKENTVSIVDASSNRILHTVDVGRAPDQIAFTQNYAYVRSTGSEEVSLIQMASIGKGTSMPVLRFPGGQEPPGKAGEDALASPIIPAPEGNAVLVANPVDRILYYYAEGMAAPMGSFQNYGRSPRAVLVVDRSLRESSPGVYSTVVRPERSGEYVVAFLLDSPRVLHCIGASVMPNPHMARKDQRAALRVEPLLQERKILAGENFRLQFKVSDVAANQPKVGLKDITVLASLSPGTWQTRTAARPVGEGIYEAAFTPPRAGVYYVFFQIPSLGVRFENIPSLILQAMEGDAPSVGGVPETKREDNK